MESRDIIGCLDYTMGGVGRGIKPPVRKAQLTIRLDKDVLAWFKSQGRGYQTRINSLLRLYMEANIDHRRQSQQR
jgi:uncharacterized protein (DUF4415 family)